MAKSGKMYICNNCGLESLTWAGKCFECGEWNSFEEVITQPKYNNIKSSNKLNLQSLETVSINDKKRLTAGEKELDRVLGGGIVVGSVLLFAGEPGIGKSTLLMQVCSSVSENNKKVLYVSGEESAHQIALRAKRMKINSDNIKLATSNSTDEIVNTIAGTKFDLVIIDSIQTIQLTGLSSNAGSVSQISSSTNALMAAAKQTNTSLIIVGHVNKEGTIAGPKILEHIVDGVFQLEGDRYGGFKILRSVKNRFGSTNETALFVMKNEGLELVDNPSKALLAERKQTDGSIVFATIEGTRPILVEVQALVNKTNFGYPKRTASGIELNRLNLLVAMLERRTKLNLSDKDIYINIVGGIKIQEPAADLAVCMAIASAVKGFTLKQDAVVFGEVGLAGEIRQVPFADKRLAEAKKLGFSLTIGSKSKDIKNANHEVVEDIKTALNKYLS